MLRTGAVALFLSVAAVALRQDPAAEPPVRMKLLIDGQEHAIVEGVESEIAIGEKKSKVKLVFEPHRHFNAAGLEFDFPRTMAFDYDSSEPESWTLDGNDVVVHIHRHGVGKVGPMMRGTLVAMLSSLDEDAEPPVRHEWTIGGKKLSGLRGRASVGPATIEVTAVGLEVGGDAIVLMVQDTVGEDGAQSAECKRVLEMLERTLKIAAK